MPCEAPVAAASMKFALVFSTCILTVPIVVGVSVSGQRIFAMRNVPGRRHHGSRDEVLQRRPHRHVGQHDRARDVRHAARHHREELRRRHRRDVGRDQHGRFRLADEDVRRHAQRLGARDLHRLLHHPRHALHDHLDDAEVVEDREERADEDDDREHLEGEDEAPVGHARLLAEGVHRPREPSEEEARALVGEPDGARDAVRERLQRLLAALPVENDDPEGHLERERPADRAPADRPPVLRERERHGEHDRQTDQTGESLHEALRLSKVAEEYSTAGRPPAAALRTRGSRRRGRARATRSSRVRRSRTSTTRRCR